jgi:hypothetical protein
LTARNYTGRAVVVNDVLSRRFFSPGRNPGGRDIHDM